MFLPQRSCLRIARGAYTITFPQTFALLSVFLSHVSILRDWLQGLDSNQHLQHGLVLSLSYPD